MGGAIVDCAKGYSASRCVTPEGRQAQAGTDWSVGRLCVAWAVGRASSGQDNEGARHTIATIATRGLSHSLPVPLCDRSPPPPAPPPPRPPSARLGLLSPRQPAQPKPKQLCSCSASSAAALSVTCCDPVEPLAVLTCFGSSSGLPTFCYTRRFSSRLSSLPKTKLAY